MRLLSRCFGLPQTSLDGSAPPPEVAPATLAPAEPLRSPIRRSLPPRPMGLHSAQRPLDRLESVRHPCDHDSARLEAELHAWQEAGDASEREDRALAVQQLVRVVQRREADVTLGHMTLGALPECIGSMDFIKCLTLADCQVNRIPTLPSGLRELRAHDIGLTGLPSLPDSLQKLQTCHNLLDTLPALPAGLRELRVAGNRLSTLLPETSADSSLPPRMTFLDASDNQLTTLQPLPRTLAELIVSNNALTVLPALPPTLRALIVARNRIARLPQIPPSVIEIDACHNRLTDLPHSILTSTFVFCINVEHNPIPEEVIDRLEYQLSVRPGQRVTLYGDDAAGRPQRLTGRFMITRHRDG